MTCRKEFLIFLVSIFVSSCSTSNQRADVLGEEFYLSKKEYSRCVSKALQDGDGNSAYRLGKHERLFGDAEESLKWFKLAYELGYNKEYCSKVIISTETYLREEEEN